MQTPDTGLLHWLDSGHPAIVMALVRNYLFMSTERSEDFALDDDQALAHVKYQITRPDFPQRRVARMLTVRALFSFMLTQDRITSDPPAQNVYPIEKAHLLQIQQQWASLCQNELSDMNLTRWLQALQG